MRVFWKKLGRETSIGTSLIMLIHNHKCYYYLYLYFIELRLFESSTYGRLIVQQCASELTLGDWTGACTLACALISRLVQGAHASTDARQQLAWRWIGRRRRVCMQPEEMDGSHSYSRSASSSARWLPPCIYQSIRQQCRLVELKKNKCR